tara:strand:- start:348 stop:1862 length:1515 start_codon:yes stop_codon:yes gene_type:complete
MIFLKKNIYFLLLINISLSGYFFNPENIGLAYSGSIAYNDMRSINPATLSSHRGLSVQIFGANFGLGNNFLTISDYNDINGSNFEDSSSSKYFPKSDVLSLFSNGIGFDSQMAFALPFSSIVYNNFSFSSRAYSFIDTVFPKSLIELALYGNQVNQSYNLDINNSVNIFSEYAFGYSKMIDAISIGFRLKYIQGLASGRTSSISDNSSYFYTDSIGFLGKAQYLINQSIGGSGFGLDIGLLSNNPINGWFFGLSISNLFAKIEWNNNNITYNYLKDSIIDKLPLRYNEKQYFSINLDTLNAISMMNTPINEIYNIDNFPIIELTDISGLEFIQSNINEFGDTILISDYGELIITDYDSYLLESTNIPDELLDSLSYNANNYRTSYPIYFNLAAEKEIDDNILICFDLSTGFNDSFKNSKKWKLSTGFVFNRLNNIPITLGISFGGNDRVNSGFSIGYRKGPFLVNYALGTRGGIFIPSLKGIDFSFSLIFKTSFLKRHTAYKSR